MPHTENVQGFVEKLGDFYELMEDGEAPAGPCRNCSRVRAHAASGRGGFVRPPGGGTVGEKLNGIHEKNDKPAEWVGGSPADWSLTPRQWDSLLREQQPGYYKSKLLKIIMVSV